MSAQGILALLIVEAAVISLAWRFLPKAGSKTCGGCCGGDGGCHPQKKA